MKPASLWQAARALGASGWLAVGLAIGCQFVPLTSLLGYEFATVAAVAATWLGLWWLLSHEPLWWRPGQAWLSWLRATFWITAALVAACALSACNAIRVPNCDLVEGLRIYALLAMGAAPVVAALAVVAAAIGGPLRGWWAYGCVVATHASSLCFLATSPSLTVYDTFFGYFAGSIYDEAIATAAAHTAFRAWTTANAVVWVALVALSRRAVLSNLGLALAAAALSLAVYANRGELGLERDRGYVAEALGGFTKTEHFDIHFDAASFDERRIRRLRDDHERRYRQLAGWLGVKPTGRLTSFVYRNREQKGELMGGRNTLVAKIWLGEMHILWSEPGDEMLAHELSHLLLRADGSGPLDLPSRWGIPLNALLEGAANAAAWGADELDDHAWSAAVIRIGKGASVAELLAPTGFWSRHSDVAYTLSGSFVRWLIDTRGSGPFRAAYKHGDFEAAYGSSLSSLEEQWRSFLAGYPLSDEQLDHARFRFDRPTLFEKRCARTIATAFEEASNALRVGRLDEATRCWEQILADDPTSLLYKSRIAGLYRANDRLERARQLADEVAGDTRSTRAQRAEALRLSGDIAWQQGEGAAALSKFREALALSTQSSSRRALGVRIEAIEGASSSPITEQAVRRYLSADAPSSAVATAELTRAMQAERSSLARYLLVVRLLGDERSAATDLLADEALRHEEDPLRRRFLLRLAAAYHTRDRLDDVACGLWGELLAAAKPSSEDAVVATLWVGLCRTEPRPLDETRPPVE